jgi:hypothetical protein
VIVDTVAMPGGEIGLGWGIKLRVDEEAYVPVKDVEAVDCHRRVASGEPLASPGRSGRLNIVLETNDGTQARPDQWERFNAKPGPAILPSLRSKSRSRNFRRCSWFYTSRDTDSRLRVHSTSHYM